MICKICGGNIDAMGMDNVSPVAGYPICTDCGETMTDEEWNELSAIKSEEQPKVCATCGQEIEGNYFIVGDNYLQTKYFDNEECNVFCSIVCLCKGLSVLEVDFKTGETFQI